MKTQIINKIALTLIALSCYSQASVWTCYVQKADADGVYSNPTITVAVSSPTNGPMTVLALNGVNYTVNISENDSVTLSSFNPLDPSTLIVSHSEGAKKVFIINSNLKSLLGCMR